jgi:hypothetical protein
MTGGGAKDQALCVEIHYFCGEDIVLVSVADSLEKPLVLKI